jgi:hypothetical protein
MYKYKCGNKKVTFRSQRKRNKKNSTGAKVCIYDQYIHDDRSINLKKEIGFQKINHL